MRLKLPIVNVYNENEKCDNCGNPPVEFIVTLDDNESVEKLCAWCFMAKIKPTKENDNVGDSL